MSKEKKRAARPQDRILCLLRKSVKVLAGVTSVRIGKQSNFLPKTAKMHGRDREQAVFDDERAPITIVGYVTDATTRGQPSNKL